MVDKYHKALKKYFGFTKFRNKQLSIIRAVLKENRDVCAIMFTGAGKSLCYQFPAIYKEKITLVISPLISLMNDQVHKLTANGVLSICLNGETSDKNQIKDDILNNKYRLVYTTPEYIILQVWGPVSWGTGYHYRDPDDDDIEPFNYNVHVRTDDDNMTESKFVGNGRPFYGVNTDWELIEDDYDY